LAVQDRYGDLTITLDTSTHTSYLAKLLKIALTCISNPDRSSG